MSQNKSNHEPPPLSEEIPVHHDLKKDGVEDILDQTIENAAVPELSKTPKVETATCKPSHDDKLEDKPKEVLVRKSDKLKFSDWLSMPFDILLKIFKVVDQQSSYNCLFVCEQWRELVLMLAKNWSEFDVTCLDNVHACEVLGVLLGNNDPKKVILQGIDEDISSVLLARCDRVNQFVCRDSRGLTADSMGFLIERMIHCHIIQVYSWEPRDIDSEAQTLRARVEAWLVHFPEAGLKTVIINEIDLGEYPSLERVRSELEEQLAQTELVRNPIGGANG